MKGEPSLQSRIGLNAANFFLAEMVGVVIPMLIAFLRQNGWSYDAIGIAVALSGLAVFLVQAPAGLIVDRLPQRRTLPAAASLVLGVCFGLILVLPLRIFLYTLAHDPRTLVVIQTLDGVGAGIYGVAILAVCADLTQGKGHFNTLSGLIATALAVGGVIGPLGCGILVEHMGFVVAFDTFALVAMIAASLFLLCMPETRSSGSTPEPAAKASFAQAVTAKEVAVE